MDENNETFRMNLHWSTPSEYVAAVNAANVTDWEVKTDDFFPYASMNAHAHAHAHTHTHTPKPQLAQKRLFFT